jgi:hypothetical protein
LKVENKGRILAIKNHDVDLIAEGAFGIEALRAIQWVDFEGRSRKMLVRQMFA